MAKYLVTGAAGFIGSNLVHALLGLGHKVRGMDNLSHGRMENLSGVDQQIDFRQADITNTEDIASACKGVDYVLHQAALGSVPRSFADPVASNHANVVGTLKVLQAAREAGVKRVVFASSSSVYGNTPTLPKREDMGTHPISPYAVTKLTGELYAQSFSLVLGLETVSLRYFNVFGPRQHPTSQYAAVIPKFIGAMLVEEEATIFGDGLQKRDFTYIDNVVSANLLASTAPADLVVGKVFNIAGGMNYSLLELHALLQQQTGCYKSPRFAPARNGDVRDSLADISRAQKAMGYQRLVGFEEGLARTVESYRKELVGRSLSALQS
ncbi:MAG TPA: SDR family oxidoreductase [Candidatus Angelobacter sp.]|nr:SDR family oxidoreductase [Candidatus Angelobacter sp.]